MAEMKYNTTDLISIVNADKEYGIDASLLEGSTKEEIIASAISGSQTSRFEVVKALPAVKDAKENVIYLVPSVNGSGDAYDEYILVKGAFEKIGHTDIDLSGYATKNTATSGPSNNATGSAGAATITTSTSNVQTATGTATISYDKANSATGSAGDGEDANTGEVGGHTHSFTGTAATISVSSSGSAASAGAHTHGFTGTSTTVINEVSGATTSVNSANNSTQSAGEHDHEVTVDSHDHGADISVLTGVSASGTTTALTGVKASETKDVVTGYASPISTKVKPFGSAGSLPSLTVSPKTVATEFSVSGGVLSLSTTSVGSASGWSAGSLPSAGTEIDVLTGLGDATTIKAVTKVASDGTASVVTGITSTTGTAAGSKSATTLTAVVGKAGGHTHGITVTATTVVTSVSSTTASVLTGGSVDSAGAHTHSVSVSGSTAYTPAGSVDSAGEHSHSYTKPTAHTHSIGSTATSVSGDVSVAMAHTHTVEIANHTHSLNSHTHTQK